MGRRLISQMIDDEAGNRLGGSGTQLRVYDDAALTTLSTLYVDGASGTTQPNPITPNSGFQTNPTANILNTDTVILVASVGTFAVGDLLAIYDGTNTVYKVITAVTPATPSVTVDSAVGTAFTATNTLLGNIDMVGHVWFFVDDAIDKYGQTKDVASTRVLPPLLFPVRVPTSTLAVDQDAVLIGTRGTINFQQGFKVVDNPGAARVDVSPAPGWNPHMMGVY